MGYLFAALALAAAGYGLRGAVYRAWDRRQQWASPPPDPQPANRYAWTACGPEDGDGDVETGEWTEIDQGDMGR